MECAYKHRASTAPAVFEQIMRSLTPFARCTRCGTICGVMRQTEAKAGAWLGVLDRACLCGALAAELEPIAEDDARPLVPHGAVPDVALIIGSMTGSLPT